MVQFDEHGVYDRERLWVDTANDGMMFAFCLVFFYDKWSHWSLACLESQSPPPFLLGLTRQAAASVPSLISLHVTLFYRWHFDIFDGAGQFRPQRGKVWERGVREHGPAVTEDMVIYIYIYACYDEALVSV